MKRLLRERMEMQKVADEESSSSDVDDEEEVADEPAFNPFALLTDEDVRGFSCGQIRYTSDHCWYCCVICV